MGLEVWGDGTFILRPTCRAHIGAVRDWHVAAAEPYAAIFQLGSTREAEIIMSEDCKGGAQEDDTTVGCTRSSNVDGSLPRCETLKFQSAVEFRSPVTGNTLVCCSSADLCGDRFTHMAGIVCSRSFGHFPFAMGFVVNGERVSDETSTSWMDLGCPQTVDLVLVPHTSKLARKLLSSVRCKSATDVRSCLKQGQDPNYLYAEGRTAQCFRGVHGCFYKQATRVVVPLVSICRGCTPYCNHLITIKLCIPGYAVEFTGNLSRI